jgi:hypothetical protein
MVSHQAERRASRPAEGTGPSQISFSGLKYALKIIKPVDSALLCLSRAEKPIIILFIKELFFRRKMLANNFIYISYKIIIIG